MPELPEVETIRRGLERTIVGRRIASVEVREPRIVSGSAEILAEKLAGRQIRRARRHGKWLFLEFGDFSVSIHLRMTGCLLYVQKGTPPAKFTHIVVRFDDDKGDLHYGDIRKFGRWAILTEPRRDVEDVPDAWLAPREEILAALRNRRGMIKHALLSQRVISGLGNIYVDEALHLAKIHPKRRLERINAAKIEVFYEGMKSILEKSIEIGGTSFRNYRDTNGVRGGYKNWLVVYGRAGKSCSCGGTIRRAVVAGRGTHYCPRCQK